MQPLSMFFPRFLAVGSWRLLAAIVCFAGVARAETIHVFLIGGQSNADGRANISGGPSPALPSPLANPQGDVPIYYGTSAPTPSGGSYPFASDGQLAVLQPGQTYFSTNFGPELSFGRSMADFYADTGDSIALIKYAVGGTNLAVDWKAGGDASTAGDGGSYRNFQTIVAKGLAALQAEHPEATLSISGMIWMQGENDSTSAAFSSAYRMNLTTFISDVRLTYGANLPFVIGQLSINQTAGTTAYRLVVREAQGDVAGADPLNGLVVTDSFGLNNDKVHFNRPAQVALGNGFAAEMQRLVAVPEPSQGSLAVTGLVALAVWGLFFAPRRRRQGKGRP